MHPRVQRQTQNDQRRKAMRPQRSSLADILSQRRMSLRASCVHACRRRMDSGCGQWAGNGSLHLNRRTAQLIHPALRLAASTRIRPARRILAQLRIWSSMTAASMRLSAETISHPSLWLPDQFQAEHCRRLPDGKLRMKTQTIAATCAAFLSERPI